MARSVSSSSRPASSSKPRTLAESRPASANYHANALARGLGLMEQLADADRPLTLSDFNASTKLPKSTLVRLLSVLVELEYLVRVDEQPSFRLGHKVQHLASAYRASLDIADVTGHYLAEVATETGHTCNLGVLDGDQVLHLCVEQPDRPLRFNAAPGSRDHLYCTGLGKVLLAGLDDEDASSRLPEGTWESFTPSTITTLPDFLRELKKVRTRGYAIDDNERSTGLRCIAVGIEIEGSMLAAVSLSGPSAEFGPTRQKEYASELGRLAESLQQDQDFVVAISNLTAQLRV